MLYFTKKMLRLLGFTYLCEQTLLVINLNKNHLRSKLNDSRQLDILHISTTAVRPDLAYVLQPRSPYNPQKFYFQSVLNLC